MKSQTFKPLTENVSSEDHLKDQVHKKTSEAIFDFIKTDRSSSEGLTIGLEGAWGSGKSHVINLVRERFSGFNDTLFFSFDAWAHEGDPLRKAFLNELINEAKRKLENQPSGSSNTEILLEALTEMREDVNRGNTTTVKSNSSPSKLGLYLAFSIVTTPIGIELLSSRPSMGFDFYLGSLSKVDWRLLFGSAFLLPLILAITKIIVSRIQSFKTLNWMFHKVWRPKRKGVSEVKETGSDDTEDSSTNSKTKFFTSIQTEFTNQKTMENGEPTSWEFSRIYSDLINTIASHNGTGFRKVVVVIDNIDRLSREHARNVWSTLQTFFQSRSSPQQSSGKPPQNVWYLVPYDRKAFCEAIDDIKDKASDSQDLSSELGLLDKNFQVVFEVPPVVSSTWVDYFSTLCTVAFENRWPARDIDDFKAAFERINSKLESSPTIREMRSIVNRAGAVVMQISHSVSARNVCLYVCMRRKYGASQLRKILISPQNSQEFQHLDISDDDRLELASIYFNVDTENAAQLLLREPIMQALQHPTSAALNDLYDNHLAGFAVAWRELKPSISGLLDSQSNNFINISNALVALAEREEKLVTHFVNPLVESWGRVFAKPSQGPALKNTLSSLDMLASYLDRRHKEYLLKLEELMRQGVASIFGYMVDNQTHLSEIIPFWKKAVSIPQIKEVWKPFDARDIEAKNWIKWRRSESEVQEYLDIELAEYPAENVGDLIHELNVFGKQASSDIWIIEEIFSREPESQVWETFLDQVVEWLENTPSNDAEYQLRLAHKIIDKYPSRFEVQVEKLTTISKIQNPKIVLDNDFVALFITRYVEKIPQQLDLNLRNFWGQSSNTENTDDVITLFSANPKPLWIKAIEGNSNRAKEYIRSGLPDLINKCDYVALNFDQVAAKLPREANDIAKVILELGLGDTLLEQFLSNPTSHIKALTCLSKHHPNLASACHFDLKRFDERHWAQLLRTGTRLCVEVGQDKSLSTAFYQMMDRVLRNSNENLESFNIDKNYYDNLTVNIIGYRQEIKRDLVATYFSLNRDFLSDASFEIIKSYIASSQRYPKDDEVISHMDFWVKNNMVGRVNWFIGTDKWFKKYSQVLSEFCKSCRHRTQALKTLSDRLNEEK